MHYDGHKRSATKQEHTTSVNTNKCKHPDCHFVVKIRENCKSMQLSLNNTSANRGTVPCCIFSSQYIKYFTSSMTCHPVYFLCSTSAPTHTLVNTNRWYTYLLPHRRPQYQHLVGVVLPTYIHPHAMTLHALLVEPQEGTVLSLCLPPIQTPFLEHKHLYTPSSLSIRQAVIGLHFTALGSICGIVDTGKHMLQV